MKEIPFTAPHETLTPGRLAGALVRQGLPVTQLPQAGLAEALARVDQVSIAAEERQHIRVLRWEAGDTLNGIDPREDPNAQLRTLYRRLLDQQGSAAYCLEIDGHITHFQPHHPAAGHPPIGEDECEAVANAHAAQILTARVHARVIEAALGHLVAGAGASPGA